MNNFIILSSNRVGSTFLREALDSHSKLNVLDEIFCWNCEYFIDFRNKVFPKMGIDPQINKYSDCSEAIELLFKKYNGFKLHRCQFANANPVWNHIANKKNIFLYRKNKIKQFISLKHSQKDKVWHVRNSDKIPERSPIKINLRNLINFIENEIEDENNKLRFLANKNYIKISYEEITCDFDKILYEVQKFIGVEPEKLQMRLKKINKKSIQENVVNYGELIDFFQNTKYEFMLNE